MRRSKRLNGKEGELTREGEPKCMGVRRAFMRLLLISRGIMNNNSARAFRSDCLNNLFCIFFFFFFAVSSNIKCAC
jgi:hypothetical protein